MKYASMAYIVIHQKIISKMKIFDIKMGYKVSEFMR